MLRLLTIRNFAIIDDLTIEFNPGFNVLTGETGAGKSIIIDALGILSGERGNASFVRSGASKAYIEGVFAISEEIRFLLADYLDPDDPDMILSRDIYSDGRSVSKTNGRNVPLSLVKQIASQFIDIHSQHDNLYLLKSEGYLDLLDQYDKSLLPLLIDYQKEFGELNKAKQKLKELETMQNSFEDIDFLTFQIKEIEDLKLYEGEIEELESEEQRFGLSQVIATSAHDTLNYLNQDQGILEQFYYANKALAKLASDKDFSMLVEQFDSLYCSLVDLKDQIAITYKHLDFNPLRLNEIKERLFEISKIKRKHGNSYELINEKLNTMKQKVHLISHFEEEVEEIKNLIQKTSVVCLQKAKQLSEKRKEVAFLLTKAILEELKDLYLEKAVFFIEFSEVELNKSGIDKIDFKISLNPGQAPKSLAKIASGGEISRLMLGLKVIFNRLQGITLTVFDEIDTGVSGKVARAVGEKMEQLGKLSQVLCITHLPQVASLGNSHFHVDKKIVDNTTQTTVELLDKASRITEIGKLISGETLSDAALVAAKELLEK